jgi:uncharacterized protein (TIGR02466 family)
MIDNLFSVPIYKASIDHQDNFTAIQTGCAVMLDRAEQIGLFERHKMAMPNTHTLTDPLFSSNLLDDPNLALLNEEIKLHIFNYMRTIGAPKAKTHSFKILHSWMTKTVNNEYAPMHTHGSADLSGVYYVQTNELDGEIFLNAPTSQIESSWCFEHIPSRVSYTPKVGHIILFPGWIQHGTHTNTTDNERISISFNVVFDRQHF